MTDNTKPGESINITCNICGENAFIVEYTPGEFGGQGEYDTYAYTIAEGLHDGDGITDFLADEADLHVCKKCRDKIKSGNFKLVEKQEPAAPSNVTDDDLSDEMLESLAKAEQDVKAGRLLSIEEIKSDVMSNGQDSAAENIKTSESATEILLETMPIEQLATKHYHNEYIDDEDNEKAKITLSDQLPTVEDVEFKNYPLIHDENDDVRCKECNEVIILGPYCLACALKFLKDKNAAKNATVNFCGDCTGYKVWCGDECLKKQDGNVATSMNDVSMKKEIINRDRDGKAADLQQRIQKETMEQKKREQAKFEQAYEKAMQKSTNPEYHLVTDPVTRITARLETDESIERRHEDLDKPGIHEYPGDPMEQLAILKLCPPSCPEDGCPARDKSSRCVKYDDFIEKNTNFEKWEQGEHVIPIIKKKQDDLE